MSKRAATSGIAVAGSLMLALSAGEASAQQGYYPQAGNSPVTINYDALSPYAAPGYRPYGGVAYGNPQPQSQFTPPQYAPQGALPVYGAPSSQFLPGQMPVGQMPATMPQPGMVQPGLPIAAGGPGYGQVAYNPITYRAMPAQAPFVAPYGNPQPQMGGLPSSTPQSYLNVPGQAPMALMGTPQPGAKPFDPNSLKPKKRKAAEPSQVEAAAAAQVAAVEEQLEANVAPAEPTPPAAPAEVPDSVPSPVDDVAVITPPASSAPAAAPSETTASETTATEAASGENTAGEPAVIEPPVSETAGGEAAPTEEAAAEAPAEEPAADGTTQAALPGNATRIVFEAEADELPAGATGQLDAVAASMMSDENVKVQVLAYASGTGENESQARRKALSRGLEVRKYLINKGVRSNRIDVRALGSKSEGSPADRVDIVPAATAG